MRKKVQHEIQADYDANYACLKKQPTLPLKDREAMKDEYAHRLVMFGREDRPSRVLKAKTLPAPRPTAAPRRAKTAVQEWEDQIVAEIKERKSWLADMHGEERAAMKARIDQLYIDLLNPPTE